MNFPESYFKETLCDLIAIDSPSGYTDKAADKVKAYIDELGYKNYKTLKGDLVAEIPGKSDKTIGIGAHIDTLGLVVSRIKSDGTLSFVKVGGSILSTLDGEYCKVYTRWGDVYTGTILSNSPSSHTYADAHELKREPENMHIRLDEEVHNAEDAKKLGILAGDFICYEPKSVFTEKGFIKSRFLDDKLGVAIILSLLKHYKDTNIVPAHNVSVVFTVYEEVLHGLSYLPTPVHEFISIDMGCVGGEHTGTEYDACICAGDGSGPYDYELTTRLVKLAKDNGLSFAVDVYQRYISDISVARRAGHDFKGAVMGPGVAASHGMERSHIRASENAWKLLNLYLTV